MNNRIFCLMLATGISCLSLACSQTSKPFPDQISEENQNNQSKTVEHYASADLTWLQYADPKADANLAIEKQDFSLLAFAGRVTSFPGIDGESSLLQQQCGYRLLPNTSDALTSKNELSLRKQLFQYAQTYNQLMSAACLKHR